MEKLVVKIEGDSTGLGKALQSAENRLNSLNTRISNTSRNLTNLQGKMSNFGQSLQAMAAANLRMATSLNQVSARLNSASTGIARTAANARTASRHVGGLSASFWDLSRKLAAINTLFFIGGSIFGTMVSSIISANSEMEKMNVLLKNMATAGTEAGKALEAKTDSKFLWDMADNAPFAIDALTKTFVKLKAAGIDPTTGSMQALVDTVAYFGGSTDQMNRAGIALSQMLSKGKVTAEELRQQLGDAVPNAMKDMAEALDLTIPELDKKMKKGLVLSADAVPKLIELWQKKYKGGAENMMTTWDGVMTRMQNQWKKMILRITEDSGENSLFTTLKKQAEDFTNFLNSTEGDEFFRNMQEGLSSIVNILSSAVKFLYEYREIIISSGKAMLAYWAGGKVIAGIVAVTNSIAGAVAVCKKLYNIKNGLQLLALLFGSNFTKAARAVGLLNANMTISLSWMVAVTSALGLLIGSVYLWNKANDESRKKQEAMAETTRQVKEQVADEITAIHNLNDATEAERKSSLQLIELKKQEVLERRKNAQAVLDEARAKLAAAKQEAEKILTPKPGSGVRDPMDRGQGLFRSGQIERLNREQTAAAWNVVERQGEYDKLMYSLNKREEELKNWQPTKITATGGETNNDETSKKIDREAQKVDSLREKYANLYVTKKQLEYEAENGTTEGFETDDAHEQGLAIAKTLGGIKQIETAYRDLKDVVRIDKQKLKDENLIKDLGHEASLAQAEVSDLKAELERGFASPEDKLNAISNKLNEKYKEDIDKAIGPNKQIIIDSINDIKEAEKELLALQDAIDYQQKTEELKESLMTEDELRQYNYDKEVERLDHLIGLYSAMGPIGNMVVSNLERYKAALDEVNKIKANPFAQWAMDARDLKANIGDGLVNSMDGFVDSLAEGKLSFSDFAKSLLKDISKIIIRALIAKAILSALGLGGGFASPNIDGLSSGSSDLSGSFISTDLLPSLTNHDGGIAGLEASSVRNVDSRMFKFAKRYHSGGFPGLRSDEVPIIAQKGEGVFTKEQMKALGGSSGATQPAPTTVNIINQSGQNLDAESSQPRFNGEQMVIDVVLKALNKPGPLRDTMKGMKGG